VEGVAYEEDLALGEPSAGLALGLPLKELPPPPPPPSSSTPLVRWRGEGVSRSGGELEFAGESEFMKGEADCINSRLGVTENDARVLGLATPVCVVTNESVAREEKKEEPTTVYVKVPPPCR